MCARSFFRFLAAADLVSNLFVILTGIGRTVAEKLAAQGCKIVLNGFGDPADIERQREDLQAQYGVEVIFCGADLSKKEDIDAMLATIESELGGVDILVNNAGIQHVSPVEQFPDRMWDKIIAVNLTAAFHLIKATLPGMRDGGYGRIINIASAHGKVGSVNKAAYVASKHGLVGLTKVVALESAKEANVTANTICPGWVLTPLVQAQIEARAHKEGKSVAQTEVDLLSEKQPSHAFVKAEQLGDFVVFLCSDSATQITGAELSMDGGWTAV